MKTPKSFAAIGSILAVTGCVEGGKIPEPTTPVVTLDVEAHSMEVQVLETREEQKIQKEDLSDPVKIILKSNQKYRDAMEIIGPINMERNKGEWDGIARCHLDPAIRAMQNKNRHITKRMNEATDAELAKGPPDLELLKCWEGQEMAKDCGERLKSSELGRILVEDKKASGEYWQALAACYQKEFKSLPVKKP